MTGTGWTWRRTSARWTGLLYLTPMLKPPVHMCLLLLPVPCTALSHARYLCSALPIHLSGVPTARLQYKLKREHGASGNATLVRACTGPFLLPLSTTLYGVLQHSQLVPEAKLRAKLSSGPLRDKQWWSYVKHAACEGGTSSIPLLIDEDCTEHHTAKNKAACLGKYFSRKCSLGSNDLQPSDLPDLPAITHPTLSNVSLSSLYCSATSVQACNIQGHRPRRYPCHGLKSTELSSPLAKIFTMCFRTGV